MTDLKYLNGYSPALLQQVRQLLESETLGALLLKRYPEAHQLGGDRPLYSYACEIKNRYLKKSPPLSKVVFDDRIHAVKNALGTHAYVARIQGGKLKAKNEIRIASVFKTAPEPFLRMIVVHELAHLKEKEHNRAFYQLCQHMEPDYHQLELDLRLYLTYLEAFGPLYGGRGGAG